MPKLIQTKSEHTYAIELAAVFISGLGMMLLVLVTVCMLALFIVSGRKFGSEVIGSVPPLTMSTEQLVSVNQLFLESGRVAGAVDDSAAAEDELRNKAAGWLSDVRHADGLRVAYRDSVLDRTAQNHARHLADSCDTTSYNEWSEMLGKTIDDGRVQSYSEAIFMVSGTGFATELPQKNQDYQRLFTQYRAFGVGVAAGSAAGACNGKYIMTMHLAE